MKIFLNKLTWDRSCVSNILKSDIYLLHENKINKNNIKYPIESGRKHLYLLIVVITTYSNVTGCKIIIKKTRDIIYINNVLSDKEIKKSIPFKITP